MTRIEYFRFVLKPLSNVIDKEDCQIDHSCMPATVFKLGKFILLNKQCAMAWNTAYTSRLLQMAPQYFL